MAKIEARLDPIGSEHTALKSDLKRRHEYELTHCKKCELAPKRTRTKIRKSISQKELQFTRKNSTKEIVTKLRRCQDNGIKGIFMRGFDLEDLINEMKSELQEEWEHKSLTLSDSQFKDCGINVNKLKRMLSLLHAKEVKSLDISRNKKLVTDIEQLYGLLQEKKVDRLNVSKCELSPNHLEAFFDSIPEENTYELQELDISNLTLPTDTSLENLASVVHRLHVRKLILAESKIDFEKLLANPLMKNITSLNLSFNTNITQHTMESIAELKALGKLVLCGCKLKSGHLQKIVDKQRQLTELDISFNRFSCKEDGEMIGRAVVECGIHNLNISHTDVTSEVLQAFLEQIKKAKTLQLEVLNVNGNWGMGNSGLVCVGEIVYRCTLMTSFQFHNCDFSPKELKTLESNQTLFEKLERLKVSDDNMIDTEDMKQINEKFNTKRDPEKQKEE